MYEVLLIQIPLVDLLGSPLFSVFREQQQCDKVTQKVRLRMKIV